MCIDAGTGDSGLVLLVDDTDAQQCFREQASLTKAASLQPSSCTQLRKAESTMTTVMIFHEVDDVEHWLGSPQREEVFGPLGITFRTFVDPAKTNRVGLIVDVPDMGTFQQVMESEATADAMKFDGVRPETILTLVES